MAEYTHKYKAGEVIYSEGDDGNDAFLVDEGEVELIHGQEGNVVATISEGEIFGELSIINGSKRITSAVAKKDTTCSTVSKEQLNERIKEADPVVQMLLVNSFNQLHASIDKNFKEKDKTTITDIKSFGSGFLANVQGQSNKDVANKIRVETDLKKAIDEGSYYMHFQPIVDMKNQDIVGLEGLVRSDKMDAGNIDPDAFMEIAEETSLIVSLGHWIIRNACQEFGNLLKDLSKHEGNVSDMFISINVSGRQLGDEKFFDVLQKALWANKLKARNAKIEITERVLTSGDTALKWIKKARGLGHSVALDDFGTGYSNLGLLGQLDINNIKIDKSFVQGMEKNKHMHTIVKSLIDMAIGMGRTVIAEGIETENQYKMLLKMGCHYGQGYLFSKPMVMDDIKKHMIGDRSAAKGKKAA